MIGNSGAVANLSESFEVLRLSVMQSSFGFNNVRRKYHNPSTGSSSSVCERYNIDIHCVRVQP